MSTAIALGLLTCLSAHAQDGDDWGEEEDSTGFDDSDVQDATATKDSPWSVSGFVRTQEALWMERLSDQPLAMARQSGELSLRYSGARWRAMATGHAEADPYYLMSENWDEATQSAYGLVLQPRDLWIARDFQSMEVSMGRQVVAWGEGVLLSPLDRINARDMRDPGMTELSDLRLPVTMLRTSVFLGSHRLDAMIVPEADFGLRGTPEGPYGFVPTMVAEADLPSMEEFEDRDALLEMFDTSWTDVQPRFSATAPQLFGRYRFRGHGVDLGLYGAWLLDKQGVIANPDLGDMESLDEGIVPGKVTPIAIPLDHFKYLLFGTSGAFVTGDVVLRWEVAAELGRTVNLGQFISDSREFNAIISERDVYTGMAGVGYTGLSNTRIDLEAQTGFVPEGTTNITMPLGMTQYGVRIARTMLRDQLEFAAFGMGIGTKLEYGYAANVSANYIIRDGLKSTVGYVHYAPGDLIGPLYGIDTHDRLFTTLRLDF